jgi:hypothetical protein
MLWILSAVLASVTAFPELNAAAPSRTPVRVKRDGHVLLTALDRRVRALNQDMKLLLARGMARSSTFSRLMSDLDATDVIVYVEFTTKLEQSVAGRLLFAVSPKNGPRYLRIQISSEGTVNQQVATIAHELQHALEVAVSPEVRDEDSFARLYDRIGKPLTPPRCYDTDAAQLTGRRVMLELQ